MFHIRSGRASGREKEREKKSFFHVHLNTRKLVKIRKSLKARFQKFVFISCLFRVDHLLLFYVHF